MLHVGYSLSLSLHILLTCKLTVVFTMRTLEYRIHEERTIGSVIGNILDDSAIRTNVPASVLNQLTFSLIATDASRTDYLRIDAKNGILRIAKRIDRDSLCFTKSECILSVDITVRPNQYFQVIKVRVIIIDVNDNRPSFNEEKLSITVPENKNPGIVFVVPEAIDLDTNENGVQGYRLSSVSSYFTLNTKRIVEGGGIQVVLTRALDREKLSRHELTIIAYDGGTPSKSGSILLDIVVSDVNDNIPQFENDSYQVRVLENATLQHPVLKLRAFDADAGQNGRITYQFTSKSETQYGSTFGIDESKGVIFLRGKLDHQRQSRYVLSVTARDNGAGSVPVAAKIIITVVDVNDHAPVITVRALPDTGEVQISENMEPLSFVAHINVVDPDDGRNGKFKCRLDDRNYFSLQNLYATEYKLVSVRKLDRETRARYLLMISCIDHGKPAKSSRKRITVSVLDQNDNWPVFSRHTFSVTIRENNQIGAFVFRANATDKDAGKNSEVRYKLTGEDSHRVRINPKTGIITAASEFDREKIQNFEFQVVGQDQGNPSKDATATIEVSIADVNDEIPAFTQSHYGFHVLEKQPLGTEVGRVFATDGDSKLFNQFTYSIFAEDVGSRDFNIDGHTGVIRTNILLDRNNTAFYSFTVIAADNRAPSFRGSANVSVYVVDRKEGPEVIGMSTSYGLIPDNFIIIFSLSFALIFMVLVLIIVVVVYARRRRRVPDRLGYISGNLVRNARRDVNIVAARGDGTPIDLNDSPHLAWDTVLAQHSDQTMAKGMVFASSNEWSLYRDISKENQIDVPGDPRNHQPDGASPLPDDVRYICSPRDNKFGARQERRRSSNGSRSIGRRNNTRMVCNRGYSVRSVSSVTKDRQDPTPVAPRRSSRTRRDSDSACSADVSHSDSGNCFSDEADSLKRQEARVIPAGSDALSSSSRDQGALVNSRAGQSQVKVKRYHTDSLSSPDSETAVSGFEKSPSDGLGQSSSSGVHRVALVHPQRNGDRFSSDCDPGEQTSLSDSCRGLCGTDYERDATDYSRDDNSRAQDFEIESDIDSFDARQETLGATGVKSPESQRSNTSDTSDKTLVGKDSAYLSICVNDTDFYESDNESRSLNILV